MKRTLLTLIAVFAFFGMQAKDDFERLPVIENDYLQEVLEAQLLLQSGMTERDFLITSFLATNQKRFHTVDMLRIRENLSKMSDQELLMLNATDFKDPTISIVLSVLVGGLGVDRFYIGDVGLGVAKLLTAGGLGIWWIIDMFLIQKKTKDNNAEDYSETVMISQVAAE